MFIVECLSGEHSDEISYDDAYALFVKRYVEMKDYMISVTKCYIILHRFLRLNN